MFSTLLMFGALSGPAHAQDAPPAPVADQVVEEEALSSFDRIDALVGAYVVAPLSYVMFYDVVFWDNTLSLAEGEQLTLPNYVVTRAPEGYVYGEVLRGLDAAAALPIVTDRMLKVGTLDVRVSTLPAPDFGLSATLIEQPADLAALGIAALPPDASDADALVSVPGLWPEPVLVDLRSGTVQAQSVTLPDNALPLNLQDQVRVIGMADPQVVMSLYETDGQPRVDVLSTTTELRQDAPPNSENAKLPIVVLWLVLGAIFFTLRMQLISLRGVPHALRVVTGRYDHEEEAGEISHFQALSSALSATVGLGNIAGVAIAVGTGGPGAIFWMNIAGLLGMSSKFVECTLGQMYRVKAKDGSVGGGPMYYLDRGLAEMGLGPIGKIAATLFAVMCIGGSFGGGNMFQANQSFAAVSEVIPILQDYPGVYGLILAFLVGLVIIGGIKRIGAAASVIVPLMCGVYVLAGLYVLAINAAHVPAAFMQIVTMAFTPEAGIGGMVGVLAIGFQRASFSNEAGVGSASIAHSAASTDEPVREGIVALLEPFIDTVVICTMTGLVVVVSDAWKIKGVSGVQMTSAAFATALPWFPMVLSITVLLFAFSTMISWSYYGESAAIWLFGSWVRMPYRSVFLVFVWLGSVISMANVVDFSDLMILGMAFPNVFGAVILSGRVKRALDSYMSRLHNGDFEVQT